MKTRAEKLREALYNSDRLLAALEVNTVGGDEAQSLILGEELLIIEQAFGEYEKSIEKMRYALDLAMRTVENASDLLGPNFNVLPTLNAIDKALK